MLCHIAITQTRSHTILKNHKLMSCLVHSCNIYHVNRFTIQSNFKANTNQNEEGSTYWYIHRHKAHELRYKFKSSKYKGANSKNQEHFNLRQHNAMHPSCYAIQNNIANTTHIIKKFIRRSKSKMCIQHGHYKTRSCKYSSSKRSTHQHVQFRPILIQIPWKLPTEIKNTIKA